MTHASWKWIVNKEKAAKAGLIILAAQVRAVDSKGILLYFPVWYLGIKLDQSVCSY